MSKLRCLGLLGGGFLLILLSINASSPFNSGLAGFWFSAPPDRSIPFLVSGFMAVIFGGIGLLHDGKV
jgi:hypothetical protein